MDHIISNKLLSTENRLIDAIILTCQKDALELFIQLSEMCSDIDFDELLLAACIYNSVKIAKWIIKNKSIKFIKSIFIKLFKTNNLIAIKLLYENYMINLSESNWQKLFFNACKYNRLELVKWILQIRPDIDVSMYNNTIFDTVCCNNYLDLAKFLLQHKPDIVCENMDSIYAYIKKYDLYKMMNWLIQINPLIDTSYEIHTYYSNFE